MRGSSKIVAMVIVAGCAGLAQAQLVNGGLETLDGTGLGWTSWTTFNNVLPELSIAQQGSISARLGGNFTGPFNVSGMWQQIPASVGQVVSGSMYFMNPSGDAIGGDNFASLNIEFYSAGGALLDVTAVRAVDATTPTDQWVLVNAGGIAPCDTATARIVPLFVQGALLFGGSALADNATLAPTGTGDPFFVRNPGFEVEGFLPGWTTFGNAFREFEFTHTGGGAIKFFGNFNGPFNVSGAFQTFCVQGGQSYTLSAWAGTPVNDAVRNGDFAVLNIEVFDANGAEVDAFPDPNDPNGAPVHFTTVQAVAPDATPGVYTQISNTTVMPANAAKVRAVLLHVQPSPSTGGGSTWFDDIEFVVDNTGGGCDGIDFNNDGLFPDDQDLVDFLSVFAGGACSNDPDCNDIDFNNDELFPDDADLVAFLTVLAGGDC